jgi:hypothetical protein
LLGTTGRPILLVALLAPLGGCPGELGDPNRFLDGFEGGAQGCGDVQKTIIETNCTPCHSTAESGGGVDLVSPDVGSRLIGKRASLACATSSRFLIDPENPSESLILHKLEESPECGVRMPLGPDPLSEAQKSCMRLWVEALVTGGGTGGAGGADSGSSGSGGTNTDSGSGDN